MNEWQAATYLLTGCDEVWRAVRCHVLNDVTIAPVIAELEQPRRAWSSSESAVTRWAAHLTQTLSGADIRGYYAALGIQLFG
ncbi:MAG: hypothetical protein ABI323_02100 [Solirubrobacteraceae bacterium]